MKDVREKDNVRPCDWSDTSARKRTPSIAGKHQVPEEAREDSAQEPLWREHGLAKTLTQGF